MLRGVVGCIGCGGQDGAWKGRGGLMLACTFGLVMGGEEKSASAAGSKVKSAPGSTKLV